MQLLAPLMRDTAKNAVSYTIVFILGHYLLVRPRTLTPNVEVCLYSEDKSLVGSEGFCAASEDMSQGGDS